MMTEDLPSEMDISGDEFEISENDPSEILQRLNEFAYYLVEHVEANLNLCLELLEEKPVPPKPNSIHTTVVSKSLSVIPKLGTALGNAFAKGESLIFEKIDKKNSKTLADLVYYYSDHKEDLRNVLIEAAVDLFSSFEHQFSKLTCDEGPKKAMLKLAKDASDRIFDHLLETEQDRNITKNEITKSIFYGNSKRNKAGIRAGRTVSENGTQWKTAKIYRKTGIVIVSDNLFYKNRETHTEKYGHRQLLSWEDLEDIKKNWEQETGFEIRPYFVTVNEDLLKTIRNYIMTKTPDEEAKLERENYHKCALEDRKAKHDEVLHTFRENFKEVLEDLEEQYKIIVNNHDDNKAVLNEISEKQCEESILNQEISRKLQEIHDDINETKTLVDMQTSIQQDIVAIKAKNEELEKSIVSVTPENIQKIVKSETVANLSGNIKEAVRETVRSMDPGPRISREVERNLKKIKKLWK